MHIIQRNLTMPRFFTVYAAITIMLFSLTGCNHDVFIEHSEISSDCEKLDWKGGSARISTGSSHVDGAFLRVSRRIDGLSYPLSGIESSWLDGTVSSFHNSIFDMEAVLIKESGTVAIDLSYCYYPDTVDIYVEVFSPYENQHKTISIMPADPFVPGEIRYQIDSWWSESSTAIAWSMSYINPYDEPREYTAFDVGQVIAKRTGNFSPYDINLSETVFPNEEFTVPIVDMGNFLPELSDIWLPYSTRIKEIDSKPLTCKQPEVVTIPPRTTCHMVLSVDYERSGFEYVLPTTTPDGTKSIDVNGIFWLSVPVSYKLTSEMSPLQ